jgi:hypothetical protein
MVLPSRGAARQNVADDEIGDLKGSMDRSLSQRSVRASRPRPTLGAIGGRRSPGHGAWRISLVPPMLDAISETGGLDRPTLPSASIDDDDSGLVGAGRFLVPAARYRSA